MFMHEKSNHEVLEELDKLVYGHAHAKKVLINTINRSRLRYYSKHARMLPDVELPPSASCMLVGDSGTGKTYLIECLRRIVNFPLVILDATQIDPPSASGGISTEDILKQIKKEVERIYSKKEMDWCFSEAGVADQMVIFIDEIDKLADRYDGSSGGKWNRDTQSSILQLIENKTKYKSLTFIYAGAFVGLDVEQEKKNKIGFYSQKEDATEHDYNEAIIKYGFMPEFLGRINHITLLDKLSKEDYKNILMNTVLPKQNEILAHQNIAPITLDDEEINKMIDKAHKSKEGVRYLYKEVGKKVIDLEFNFETQQIKGVGHVNSDEHIKHSGIGKCNITS